MIQFDSGKQWNFPSTLGEEFQTRTSRQNSDGVGFMVTTAPDLDSANEDEFVFVSPPPIPFPRVFPGL